jgi:hypothetical protein
MINILRHWQGMVTMNKIMKLSSPYQVNQPGYGKLLPGTEWLMLLFEQSRMPALQEWCISFKEVIISRGEIKNFLNKSLIICLFKILFLSLTNHSIIIWFLF